jgi:hypothetical protein
MCSQFGFVIFWQKDFGAKAAHKMLVKLTSGVNITIKTLFFINNGGTKCARACSLFETCLTFAIET